MFSWNGKISSMILPKSIIIRILLPLMGMANVPDSFVQKNELKIAMAQIFCIDGDRSGNFVRIEEAIIEACEKEADIVCFPETSLLGWVNPVAHFKAFAIPGNDADKLCSLANQYNVYLCIGLAEKVEDKLFDTVILIDDQGNILLKHRKINILTTLMTPPYTPGSEVKAVDTKYGRIGMLICADSFEDNILKKMRNQKPDLVLIPFGWAANEDQWPQHGNELTKTVQNSAKTIGCPVIGTDLVGRISNGPWIGLTYGGQSVASDEYGKILYRCKDRDREVKVITIWER
jgi:predicted amidohydrolase